MTTVRLGRLADADLDLILDHSIRHYGHAVAEAYLRRIHANFDRLSDHPELGALRPEVEPGLRSLSAGEHRIFYHLDDKGVLIVRVLHKRMDVDRWF